MLETLNLARKCTPICSFRKYTFQCLGFINFADVSIFLQKISIFCSKKYLYSRQQCESFARDFLFSGFARQKVYVTKNITLTLQSLCKILCPESGPRTAPNWPEIRKITMTSQFFDRTSTSIFLTLFCSSCQVQLLVEVSCQYHHWFWNYDKYFL